MHGCLMCMFACIYMTGSNCLYVDYLDMVICLSLSVGTSCEGGHHQPQTGDGKIGAGSDIKEIQYHLISAKCLSLSVGT